MADRKIVQIAAMPMTDNENITYPPAVVALADDGTLWELNFSHATHKWGSWSQLPELPKN